MDIGRHLAVFRDDPEAAVAEVTDAADRLAPDAPEPTAAHRALVQLLDDIMSLAARAEGGHPALKASLRAARHLQPTALEELARVPPEEIAGFCAVLRDRLAAVVDAAGTG